MAFTFSHRNGCWTIIGLTWACCKSVVRSTSNFHRSNLSGRWKDSPLEPYSTQLLTNSDFK
jgi:hypothetical protein